MHYIIDNDDGTREIRLAIKRKDTADKTIFKRIKKLGYTPIVEQGVMLTRMHVPDSANPTLFAVVFIDC
jgi:hypothetical protein